MNIGKSSTRTSPYVLLLLFDLFSEIILEMIILLLFAMYDTLFANITVSWSFLKPHSTLIITPEVGSSPPFHQIQS